MDTAVGLVQAYLHLNGYLVLTEVPVQLGAGHAYYSETDLDILAVRFPHDVEHRPHSGSSWEEFFTGADPILGLSNDHLDLIIGEVKEGDSHANPALRRQNTIHFALRRLGCCDFADMDDVTQRVARQGAITLKMRGGATCRIRLVVFGGKGALQDEGLLEIPLRHVTLFVQERLREYRPVLEGVQFKDPTLSMLYLFEKLGLALEDHSNDPGQAPRPPFKP